MEINEKSTGGYTGKEIARYALDYFFPIVDCSNFKVTDAIFNHEPETQNQVNLRNDLMDLIRDKSVPSFRAMAMLPSCDEKQIIFGRGLWPCMTHLNGHDMIPSVHLFLPEYASQTGNINQWNMFLGQLIYDFSAEFLLAKYELSPEEAINKAWHVVCDDTSDYANIGTDIPESTGRKVVDGFRWYDLGNKERIILYSKINEIEYYADVGESFRKTSNKSIVHEPYDKRDIYKIYEDDWKRESISNYPLPWIVLNAPILKD